MILSGGRWLTIADAVRLWNGGHDAARHRLAHEKLRFLQNCFEAQERARADEAWVRQQVWYEPAAPPAELRYWAERHVRDALAYFRDDGPVDIGFVRELPAEEAGRRLRNGGGDDLIASPVRIWGRCEGRRVVFNVAIPDGDQLMETAAHEACHVRQYTVDGGFPSDERARERQEAEARAFGEAWARGALARPAADVAAPHGWTFVLDAGGERLYRDAQGYLHWLVAA